MKRLIQKLIRKTINWAYGTQVDLECVIAYNRIENMICEVSDEIMRISETEKEFIKKHKQGKD